MEKMVGKEPEAAGGGDQGQEDGAEKVEGETAAAPVEKKVKFVLPGEEETNTAKKAVKFGDEDEIIDNAEPAEISTKSILKKDGEKETEQVIQNSESLDKLEEQNSLNEREESQSLKSKTPTPTPVST